LLDIADLELCYCGTVQSEFIFHYLGNEGKSPLTLKVNQEISEIIKGSQIKMILKPLDYLSDSADFFEIVPDLMSKYNLLPNDAQILAGTILHKIKYLATLDSDFKTACLAEGIEVIDSPEKLGQIF
jgi:uncharacterized protein